MIALFIPTQAKYSCASIQNSAGCQSHLHRPLNHHVQKQHGTIPTFCVHKIASVVNAHHLEGTDFTFTVTNLISRAPLLMHIPFHIMKCTCQSYEPTTRKKWLTLV